jgi:hypothetical protein
MTTNQRKLEDYRAGNLVAAEIIAADPGRYPPGSLLAIWAELVLGPQTKNNSRAEIGRPA